MKPKLILSFLSILVWAQQHYTGWYAMNLKGKVETYTEKSYTAFLNNGKWTKSPGAEVQSFVISNFSASGRGGDYIIFDKDSSVNFQVINEYDSNGVIVGDKNMHKGKLLHRDVIKDTYKNMTALHIDRYNSSHTLIQRIVNTIDGKDNVIHTQIWDLERGNKLSYEKWIRYNESRNPVMAIQSYPMQSIKDTTISQYLKFDALGNWTEKVEKSKLFPGERDFDKFVIFKRVFKYY